MQATQTSDPSSLSPAIAMRNLFLVSTAVWAGLASGQCSSSSIPECAQSCISNAAASSTTCGATDYTCQCTDANQEVMLQTAENCLVASCGEAMTYRPCDPLPPILSPPARVQLPPRVTDRLS